MRAVDPTGAKDEIFAADVFDGLFAGQLAGAIDIEWIGRVGFDPRLRLAAVKDVVGGVVNEKGVALAGFFGENARRLLVDGVGEIALGFGAIDGGVGGGVENEIGRGAADQSAGLIGIGEIDGFAIDGDDGADAGKDAFQLAAKLAGVADDENAGICRRICGRRLTFRSCGRAPEQVEVHCSHSNCDEAAAPWQRQAVARRRDCPYNLG